MRTLPLAVRAPGLGRVHAFLVWWICWGTVWLYFRLAHRVRAEGWERVPAEGRLVVVSNHDSHLDPPLVGAVIGWRRASAFLARDTLFRFRPFGAFLRFLGSVPLDRGGRGAGAFRSAIAAIETGRAVLLFPEGTRSDDGSVGRFKPGFTLLMRRTGATVLPVGVAGTFRAWPRSRRGPRLGTRVAVAVGEPISADELLAFGDADACELVRDRIVALTEVARQRLGDAPAPDASA